MRTLGLLGGTTWISTREYYTHLNRMVQAQLGGVESARLLISSLNFGDLQRNNLANNQAANRELVLSGCRELENAGAAAVMICANTLHMFAADIQNELGVPLINLIDAVASEATQLGLRKLLLLGTRYTMELGIYDGVMAAANIEMVLPDEATREEIHRTIYDEMAKDQFLESTRQLYRETIASAVKRGADGVIMGCTEIPILLGGAQLGVPLLDTAEIHCRKGVEFMLS